MKKLLFALLTIAVLFSLTACGSAAQPAATDAAVADGSVPTPEAAGGAIPDAVSDILTDAPVAVPAFSAVDTAGNAVTEEFFKQNKLTMINFWEPWCGPCVGEMPDLQKLYEAYADQGFAILGVYSTAEGAADVLSECGVTYPVVQYVSEFDQFQTGYVPTTVFVDAQGGTVSVPIAGSNSYEGWETLVAYFLQ